MASDLLAFERVADPHLDRPAGMSSETQLGVVTTTEVKPVLPNETGQVPAPSSAAPAASSSSSTANTELPAPAATTDNRSIPDKVKDWAIKEYRSTWFQLFLRWVFIFTAGFIFYAIGTRHIWAFFVLSSLVPLAMAAVHFIWAAAVGSQEKVPIFDETFTSIWLIPVKFCTFALQNFAFIMIYWYGTDDDMSQAMTWVLRINVFEVFVDQIKEKMFIYWPSSIWLLISYDLKMVMHPNYLLVWTNWDATFIVIYTAWFVGWIGNRSGTTSDRFLIIAHTLFPLFCPPTLWFSVRTFTGMFMLAFSYLKVAAPVITYKCITELEGFRHIYNSIFSAVFIAVLIYPVMNRHMDIRFDEH